MAIMDEGLALPADLVGLTTRHAVYRCYSDQGELLYIGTTGHLGRRLAAHAEKIWFLQVRGITLEWYADEFEAGAAERRAIHVEHPKYNVVHRGARSIPAHSPRTHSRSMRRRRRPPTDPIAEAAELLAANPSISGSEIGRRLGMHPSSGRRFLVRLTQKHPLEGAREQGGE